MLLSKETKSQAIGSVRFFGNTRVLILSALFIAASIVLGKYLSFTVGAIRISLENLTILMAGIMFGPLIGLAVGVGADIIGCLMVGYTISPIITLGAGCVGFFSGLFNKVQEGVSTATANVENVLNNFIEALAILLVTSCLIPILVLIFFVWLVKMLLGLNIDIPTSVRK